VTVSVKFDRVANRILSYALRGTNNGLGVAVNSVHCIFQADNQEKYSSTITARTGPAAGVFTYASPISINNTVNTPSGNIQRVGLQNLSVGADLIRMTVVGVAGSGSEVIVDSISTSVSQVLGISLKMSLGFGDSTIKFSNSLRNAWLTSMLDGTNLAAMVLVDSSSTMTIYDGSPPDTADDAATGNVLWQKALTTTTWASGSGAGLDLAATLSANASASGTIGYARIKHGSNGNCIQIENVGTSGNLVTSANTTTAGNNLDVTNATIVFGEWH